MLRWFRQPALERRDLARISGALAVLNIGLGLVVVLGAPLFASLLGDERLTAMLQWMSLQFVLNALEAVPYSLAYRSMAYKRLALVELASTMVSSVTTLSLALSGAGVWALVFGYLAGAVTRTSLYVWLGGFVWPSFDFRGIGPHIKFGSRVTVGRLLWQATWQADILIAGRAFAQETVGLLLRVDAPRDAADVEGHVGHQPGRAPPSRGFRTSGRDCGCGSCMRCAYWPSPRFPRCGDVVGRPGVHRGRARPELAAGERGIADRELRDTHADAADGAGDGPDGNRPRGSRAAQHDDRRTVLPIAFLIGARFGLLGLASSGCWLSRWCSR